MLEPVEVELVLVLEEMVVLVGNIKMELVQMEIQGKVVEM